MNISSFINLINTECRSNFFKDDYLSSVLFPRGKRGEAFNTSINTEKRKRKKSLIFH